MNYKKVGPQEFNEDKIYNRTDKYYNSNQMAKQIRKYDRTHFIVVVSNYAWESYFSDDLGRTLENCGAFLIKEFMHQGARRFSNHTRTFEKVLYNDN